MKTENFFCFVLSRFRTPPPAVGRDLVPVNGRLKGGDRNPLRASWPVLVAACRPLWLWMGTDGVDGLVSPCLCRCGVVRCGTYLSGIHGGCALGPLEPRNVTTPYSVLHNALARM